MKLNFGIANKLTKAIICIFVCLFISSCGGGSGSDTTTQPPIQTGSSDWDTMEWDQDNWG